MWTTQVVSGRMYVWTRRCVLTVRTVFSKRYDKLDDVFGKCLNPEVAKFFEPTYLTTSKITRLSSLIESKFLFGLDWNDLHTQCIFRSILHSK